MYLFLIILILCLVGYLMLKKNPKTLELNNSYDWSVMRHRVKLNDNLNKQIYDFALQNKFIAKENKYCVIGHSVMELQTALSNLTQNKTYFKRGRKYRPWILEKEQSLNRNKNSSNVIEITNEGYIPDDENEFNYNK